MQSGAGDKLGEIIEKCKKLDKSWQSPFYRGGRQDSSNNVAELNIYLSFPDFVYLNSTTVYKRWSSSSHCWRWRWLPWLCWAQCLVSGVWALSVFLPICYLLPSNYVRQPLSSSSSSSSSSSLSSSSSSSLQLSSASSSLSLKLLEKFSSFNCHQSTSPTRRRKRWLKSSKCFCQINLSKSPIPKCNCSNRRKKI